MVRILTLALVGALSLGAQQYDLLLKGGTVVDAKNGLNAVRDVAIRDGKIAAVAANIPAGQALKTVDVTGLYVAPGLVDLHVHVFAGEGREYMGESSVMPDDHSFRSGVTTMVDAGSSGAKSFTRFKSRVIDKSKTRVLAFLNIVGTGMGGGSDVEQNVAELDAKLCAERVKQFKGTIVGVKTAHYQAPTWAAVDGALACAGEAGVPIMVDFGKFTPERPHEELITKKLRAGDMYTHAYLAWVPMLDKQGKVRDYLLEGRKRGVLFDVGHGGGSLVFRHAVPAMKQGFWPDSISTDLHISSMNAGMKDMTNVMSKFLAMGMPMHEVIARSSWNPARQIKREDLGHLSVGAGADIAVLSVLNGKFGYTDSYAARLRADKKIVAEMTLRDGRVVWDLNGLSREDWDKLGEYTAQGDGRWDATLGQTVRERK
ncbi:MAG: amidohydrolase/deacetylase family metallohydrolase [Acidobacteria bacterium]|nr:amidohydrolase/deacetylase family metallohydrolase [Acidobacteriota bacterium]